MNKYYTCNENSKIIEMDENVKPTNILDYEFLFHVNNDVKKSFPYLISKLRGKWIMRFKHLDFDEKWKECCQLYDEGKLTGIRELGCSTGYKNPQFSDHTEYEIFFVCGPASDRKVILEYGNNLLNYIPYCSNDERMTYKTDGEKDSKTKKSPENYFYQIRVPRCESSDGKVNQIFVISKNETVEIDENKAPTEIQDYEFLGFLNTNIYNSFDNLDKKICGSWKMYFKNAEGFDQKWRECCKLYDEGKLSGIQRLKCSTGFKNPTKSDHTTGEILFYCGPAIDKLKMLEFGENLLKHIPYFYESGFMDFKSKYIEYQIPIPKDESSDVIINRIFLLSDYINNTYEEVIETDENKPPTEILDYAFVQYQNMNISNSFPNFELSGQWMMFFKKAENFDQKWKDSCKLYDEGKLTGISKIGSSTGYQTVRTNEHDLGAIFFFCGPATDKIKILGYGRNLLKYIPYFSADYGHMAYKTREQIYKGSRATGNRDNSLYRILVPRDESSDIEINRIFLWSETEKKSKQIDENPIPTEVLDYEFINYINNFIFNDIYNSFSYETRKLWGSWKMFFKITEGFDQKWKDCCKLYDEGKLTGIQRLKCSTGFKNPKKSDHTTGEIVFYCGPATDKLKMLEVGENLLKNIPYYNDSGLMNFLSNGPVENDRHIRHEIPVPKNGLSDIKVNRFLFYKVDGRIIKTDQDKKPTEVLDHPIMHYVNYCIYNSFPYYNSELSGKWMMFFKHAENFDQKWKDCCKLYDEGKLIGIQYIKCSTGYKSSKTTKHDVGVIFFKCGPSNDKNKMFEYGENLLKCIPYFTDAGHMAYKTSEQTHKGTRATGNQDNYFYRMPVPRRPEVPK